MSGLTTGAPAPSFPPNVSPFAIVGDAMAPQLRSGDFLLVTPAERYDGEGVYILDYGDGQGSPYLAQRMVGHDAVLIRHPNPLYTCHCVDLVEFNTACRAKAVADVRMRVGLHELAGTRLMAAE